MKFKFTLLFIFIFIIAPRIFSHDYVLTPEKFIFKKGENMLVHLMVGDIFNFEFERELQLNMTPRFQLYTKDRITNLLVNATDSMIPVAEHEIDFEGLGLLVMQRSPTVISETKQEFHDFLIEHRVNGATFDSTLWRKPEIKEKYSRYLKTLVLSGASVSEDFFRKPVGMKLELIMHMNPFALQPEEEILFEVLFDGKPLVNALIGFTQQTYKSAPITTYAFTDKKGYCSFLPALDATCVVTCVYIEQLPLGNEADVESFWASYSFKVLNGEE